MTDHEMCPEHPDERAHWPGGAGCVGCELDDVLASALAAYQHRQASKPVEPADAP